MTLPRLKFTITYKGDAHSPHIGCAASFVSDLDQQIIKIGKLRSSHMWLDCPDNLVARMHAVIEISEDEVRVIDLGSFTGCRLNGQKVGKNAKVAHGDKLTFGNFDVAVEYVQVREKPLRFGTENDMQPELVDVSALFDSKAQRDTRDAQTNEGELDEILDEERVGDKHPFQGFNVVERVRLTWYYVRLNLLHAPASRKKMVNWMFGSEESNVQARTVPPPVEGPSRRLARIKLRKLKQEKRIDHAGPWSGERVGALPYYTYVALFTVIGMLIPAASAAVGLLADEDALAVAKKADAPPPASQFEWKPETKPEAPDLEVEIEETPAVEIEETPAVVRRYRVRNQAMAEVEWSTDFDAVQERLKTLNAEHGEGSHWIEVQ